MLWAPTFRFLGFRATAGSHQLNGMMRLSCSERKWGFPKIRGTLFKGSHNKDYRILGSILGSPCFGKVPNSVIVFHWLCVYRQQNINHCSIRCWFRARRSASSYLSTWTLMVPDRRQRRNLKEELLRLPCSGVILRREGPNGFQGEPLPP